MHGTTEAGSARHVERAPSTEAEAETLAAEQERGPTKTRDDYTKESEKVCFRVQQAQGRAANESAGGRKTKESSEGPEGLDDRKRGREHPR